MKNYVCRTVTELPGYMQAQVRVQDNTTIHAGEIYVADTLDNGLHYGNFTYYIPAIISDVETQDPVIVLDGSFEVLEDGRRPEGQPNFLEYGFNSEIPCVVLRPEKAQTLRIGVNAINETVNVGDFLVPTAGQYKWTAQATMPAEGLALKVEKISEVGIGGMFGMQTEKVAEVIVARD